MMPETKSNNKTEPINEGEILDFNNPNFIFAPKEHHEWRQQGPYVICKSCELQHAVFIGMERLLIGINDTGQPIFKNRF
jgi:hypothetical protein